VASDLDGVSLQLTKAVPRPDHHGTLTYLGIGSGEAAEIGRQFLGGQTLKSREGSPVEALAEDDGAYVGRERWCGEPKRRVRPARRARDGVR
jgi:hypothetical protein